MRSVTLVLLVAAAMAGCLDTDAPADDASAAQPTGPAEDCIPADKNNDGVSVNGEYYTVDGQVWEESNGITNLQRIETCEGPSDTQVA